MSQAGAGYSLMEKILGELFGYIIGISSSIAILSLAVCIIRYMTSDDSHELSQLKKDAKNVLAGWIIINMVGAIMTMIFQMITNLGI